LRQALPGGPPPPPARRAFSAFALGALLAGPVAARAAATARAASDSGGSQTRLFAATGSVQVAFTPGDPIDDILIGIVAQARREVLVQIFSFTHKRIARALIDAHRRGVRVEVIADDQQDRQLPNSALADLVRNGVPVYLDPEQSSAHNKVMIVDAASEQAVLVTGSYNFTWSAQRRNAENILVLRGNPALAQAFAENWRRLRVHAVEYRLRGRR
jgi:phosphatidylserine/phosphatidylglycerophosphate/cardiolipin synthase-like enzyme